MSKSWHEMTPEERLADRIAKNRAMDKRISEKVVPEKKSSSEVATRQRAVRNTLDRFQQIKTTQGMDAAADFVRSRTVVEGTGE
ncbi:MAG TPA: hypothetical protein VK789_02845 [Bryobacteraceae bacterium]|jgi:hypothetical protein|nr:hypothetical protein [Bryobacteraceae bacterium]